MPHLRLAPAALRDLQKIRDFLSPKNPAAAKRAASTITKAVELLKKYPQIGRPARGMGPEYKELLIDFGNSGYVALYHFESDLVTILALRHQREVGSLPEEEIDLA